MPGRAHVDDEVGDALLRRRVGIGAREQDAEVRDVRERRPDLLPVHDVLLAVARRARVVQRREVAARVGLAEQLAPDLGAVEDAGQPRAAAGLRCPRRAASARPSRCRSGSAGAGTFSSRITSSIASCSIGIGVEAPGRGPVRRDVAGPGEHAVPVGRELAVRGVLGDELPQPLRRGRSSLTVRTLLAPSSPIIRAGDRRRTPLVNAES